MILFFYLFSPTIQTCLAPLSGACIVCPYYQYLSGGVCTDLQSTLYQSNVYVQASGSCVNTCIGNLNYFNPKGTKLDPYNGLVQALQKEYTNSQQYFGGTIIFNLQITNHFITQSDIQALTTPYLFRRKLFKITLQPYDMSAPQQDQTVFNISPNVYIYLKTDLLSFFTGYSLQIYNIIFDGSELPNLLDTSQLNSNLKSLTCTTNAICNIQGLNFVSIPPSRYQYGLFNLETVYDLNIDFRSNTPNQIYQNFVTANSKYFDSTTFVQSKLILQNCIFQNIYLGITQGSTIYSGMRSIILPIVGQNTIILNSVKLISNFFPSGFLNQIYVDPIYQGVNTYSNEVQNTSIISYIFSNTLMINQYNLLQIGSILTNQPSNNIQLQYYNKIIYLNLFQASIINFIFYNNSFLPLFQNLTIYGTVGQLFQIQSSTLNLSSVNISLNTNYQLINVLSQGNLRLIAGFIQNSKINLLSTLTNYEEQKFLINGNQYDFILVQGITFSILTANLFRQFNQAALFDTCQFNQINIIPGQQLFAISVQDNTNDPLTLSNSQFQGLQASSQSYLIFFNSVGSFVNMNNCNFDNLINITFFGNSDSPFCYNFQTISITNSQNVAINTQNRPSIVQVNGMIVNNLVSIYALFQSYLEEGGRPAIHYQNLNFSNMQMPNVVLLSSRNMAINFTNILFNNVNTSSHIILICCKILSQWINFTIINSNVKSYFFLSTGEMYISGLTINNSIAQSQLFTSQIQTTFKMDNIKIYSPIDLFFFNQFQDLNSIIINSIFQGRLSNLLQLNQVSQIILSNCTFIDDQQFNYKYNLMQIQESVDIQILNCSFVGINTGLINMQSSNTLTINSTNFTNTKCNTFQCIQIENQQQSIILFNNQFNVIQSNNIIFSFRYCQSLVILQNQILSPSIQGDLLYCFQTDLQLTSNKINNVQSTGALDYVIEIIDTFSALINNLQINNNIQDYGNIRLQLVNNVIIQNIILNNIKSINQNSILDLQKFQNLQLNQITLSNINSQFSVIMILSILKNLQIISKDISCINNTGQFSACINLVTESNFILSNLIVTNTTGNVIYISAIANVQVQFYMVKIDGAKNNLGLNRIFSIISASVYFYVLIAKNMQDYNYVFESKDSSLSLIGCALSAMRPLKDKEFTIFHQSNSQLTLIQSQIIQVRGQNDTYLYGLALLEQSSTGYINQSFIIGFNNYVVKSTQSQLIIQSSTFSNNTNTMFFVLLDSNLKMYDSIFEIIQCQYFFSIQTSDLINQFQTTIQNISIQFTDSLNLGSISQINTVNFFYFQIISLNNNIGNGLTLTDIPNININNSKFNSLQLDNGGCAYINAQQQNSIILIDNTQFVNCKASYSGGALYFNNKTSIVIQKSQFVKNQAQVGGAISHNGNVVMKIDNTLFNFNYAILYGGAMACLIIQPNVTNSNFKQNIAGSQEEIGSYGSVVKYVKTTQNQLTSQFSDYIRDQLVYTNSTASIEIASGQQIYLVFAILDQDNKLVYNDIYTTATLTSVTGSQTLVQGGTVQSKNGLLIYDNLVITQQPGSDFSLNLIVNFAYGNAQVDKTATFSQKNASFTFKFNSRLCNRGEILNSDNTCLKCLQDTYSLVDSTDTRLQSQSCNYCPKNAFCIEEAIYPKAGYWILDQNSILVLPCLEPTFCLGQEELFQSRIATNNTYQIAAIKVQTAQMYSKQCIAGQQNALCQECVQGYFRYTQTQACQPCQGNKAATMILLMLLLALLMAYSIYQSIEYMSKNQSGQDKAVLLKIILNYFQTLTLLGGINLNWSPNISGVFDFSQNLFGTSFNFVSIQCLSSNYAQDEETQYYLKLVFTISVPFIVFTANTIYFLIQITCNWKSEISKMSSKKESMKQTFQEYKGISIYVIVLNGVVCIHLFYSLLTSTPTDLFYCQQIAQDEFGTSISYLSKNLNIQCWTTKFTYWFYLFGIFLSIFFGLGVPLLFSAYMYVYRDDLRELDSQYQSEFMLKSLKKSDLQSSQKKSIFQSAIDNKQGLQVSDIKLKNQPYEQSEHLKGISEYQNDTSFQVNKKEITRMKSIKSKMNATKSLHKSLKRKGIKQSEVFTFLIDPYKSEVFFWEIVVLIRKFVLIIIGLILGTSTNSNNSIKYLLLNVYLIISFRINLLFDPYFSPLFNLLENYSFIAVILSCISGIISTAFDSQVAQGLSDIIFFITNGSYICLMAVSFIAFTYAQENNDLLLQKELKWFQKLFKRILRKHKRRVQLDGKQMIKSNLSLRN